MKKLIIAIIITSLTFQSCKKSTAELRQVSSFTVVNAAVNITSAKVYAADHEIIWKTLPASDAVKYAASAGFSVFAGNNNIRAVDGTDTTMALFSSTKQEEFKQAAFNTLFLCGNTGAYEGILINNDNIVNRKDSVIGIRFINLSPNSSPLNITLSTTPTVNEATGLSYKQKTDFKTYPAISSTTPMVFQLRDASGVLLASYTLPITPVSPYFSAGISLARFKNITLVVKGLQGTTSGISALGIFPVAHY